MDNLNIDDRLNEADGVDDNATSIKLLDYLPAYSKHVNKNAETIAMKLMQHCMVYLMSPKCPKIYVLDEEKFCLNAMFEEKTKREEKEIELQI